MKRWIAAAFLLAAGITAGLPAEEVVDFTREKLPVVLHRPQERRRASPMAGGDLKSVGIVRKRGILNFSSTGNFFCRNLSARKSG